MMKKNKNSLRSGLIRQNCGWGAVVGGESVNVHFDINLSTPITAVKG